MFSRRTLIKSAIAGTAITAGGIGLAYGARQRVDGGRISGRKKLPIPQLLDGELKNSVRQYDLNLQWGQSEFLPGLMTRTMGINGPYLGPTLRLKDGENIRMKVKNQLGEQSTLHWHGLHVPAYADGGPHQVIENGQTWAPEFQVKQKASTYWYHSHQLHKTGVQAYHGLAGLIYVEDEETNSLDLPRTYGVDDIPLVLQDKRFSRDGSLLYLGNMRDQMMGMRGDILLVNGAIAPYFEAKNDKLRLRVLNGSNARIYNLGFSDNRSYQVIAGDGSLLPTPVVRRQVQLSPGERVEVVVDLSDGRDVTFMSAATSHSQRNGMMDRKGGRGMMGMMDDDNMSFDILHIKPNSDLIKSANIPGKLIDLQRPSLDDVSVTRRFTLDMGMGMGMMRGGGRDMMTINGRSMQMNRIDARVKLGATEIWEIINTSWMAHPFHIHDIQFHVLDRNGSPPLSVESGLKDTVLVRPRERVRILAKFEDYADPDLPYMYHCHILEHEDAGMMGQFIVEA
jgi:FtsP/CotA-like multicopper oxidase with cupredoxin domain